MNENDHDLLIEMRTEMKGVRDDIRELKEGNDRRLGNLEGDHVSRSEYEALVKAVGALQNYRWFVVGGLALLAFAISQATNLFGNLKL